MNEGSPLISSSFQIGSSGQILLDSSYLNGLDVEWAGVVQSQFDGQVADGFLGLNLAWLGSLSTIMIILEVQIWYFLNMI